MIDIPVGKALIAVEANKDNPCLGCVFTDPNGCTVVNGDVTERYIMCESWQRCDDRNVIFKLVDWPGEGAASG